MYSKSKRLIAGFLVVLMTLCMLPVDVLDSVGMVHAAETDVVTEEQDNSSEPDTTQPDAVDDESIYYTSDESDSTTERDSATEDTSYPAEAASYLAEDISVQTTSESGKLLVLNVSDMPIGDVDPGPLVENSIFSLTGDYVMTVDTSSKSIDGFDFTKRLKTLWHGNGDDFIITFTPEKNGIFTVYAMSANSSESRNLILTDGDEDNYTFLTDGVELKKFTAPVTANTKYKLYSEYIGINMYYLAVEYAVDLGDTTLSVEVDDSKGNKINEPVYTGEEYVIKTAVTPTAGGDALEESRYTVSYERTEDDGATWNTTDDLTSAGKIRVKVTPAEGGNLIGDAKVSDVIEIKKANLTIENKSINILPDTTETSGTLDIAKMFADIPGAADFEYALDESVQGYTVGNIIENPAVANGKLTYDIKSPKPATPEAAVLGIKVTSKNYTDITFKITITMKSIVTVTVTIAPQQHVYDKTAYDFKTNVNITAVTGTGIDETNKAEVIADLTTNMTYKYKLDNSQEAAADAKPVNAGTYTVAVELADASAYTLADNPTAELTISPRPLKIKPNNVKWDKLLEKAPLSGTAAKDDYAFVAVADENDSSIVYNGLITGDTIGTEPTFKYYKNYQNESSAEMTAADWSALKNNDTVDIVASGAEAENYVITYDKGTLTALVRSIKKDMAVIPASGASLLASELEHKTYTTSTLVADDHFVITANENSTVVVDSENNKKRIKLGGKGTQLNRSIGFTTSRASTLKIECISSGDADRQLVVAKLNADDTVTECVGAKYTINGGDEKTYDETSGNRIPVVKNTNSIIEMQLKEAGTYFIYSAMSGINVYEVSVTYPQVPTYNIQLDKFGITAEMASVTQPDNAVTSAAEGEVVSLSSVVTVVVNDGYALIGWSVTTRYGYNVFKVIFDAGDTTTDYSFIMPAEMVRVAPIIIKKGVILPPVAIPGVEDGYCELPKGEKVKLEPIGTPDHIYYTLGNEKIISDPRTSKDRIEYFADKSQEIEITEKMNVLNVVAEKDNKFSEVVTYKYDIIQPLVVTTLSRVSLSGTARVGKTLTATPEFLPTYASPDVSYAWYRVTSEGAPILIAADTNTYTIADDDIDCTIRVEVTFIDEMGTAQTKSASKKVISSAAKGIGLEIEFNDGTVYTYTGAKIMPAITVTNNKVKLVEGTDYTVSYTNNIKAGKAAGNDYDRRAPGVTVTGKGNFSGKTSANFTIMPKSLGSADVDDNIDDDTDIDADVAVAAADIDDFINDADEESSANATVDVIAKKVVVVENSKATPVVLYNGVKLTAKDYDVIAPKNLNTKRWTLAETDGEIKLRGKGNFTGECKLDVTVISRTAARNSKITADFEDRQEVRNLTYTGKSIEPEFNVSSRAAEDGILSDGEDYVVSYPADTTSAGVKKVTILGISENCTGSITKSYTIKPARGGELKVVEGIKDSYDFVSTGVTFGGELKVSYVDTENEINLDKLTEGVDYKITYSNNKKAGTTAGYVLTGLGNFKGLRTPKKNFTIKPLALSDTAKEAGTIQVIAADKIFTRRGAYKSVPTVIVNGELVKASEYTVTYKVIGVDENWSNRPGVIESIPDGESVTVKVRIKAKRATGNYGVIPDEGDELEGEYKVVNIAGKADLAKARIIFQNSDGLNAAKVGYKGNPVKPYKAVIKSRGVDDIEVVLDETSEEFATKGYTAMGFDVTYANNVLKGRATVVISVKAGNTKYAGSKSANFNIVQKNLQKDLKDGEGFLPFAANFFEQFFN